jgi:hypothetical protein
MDEALNHRHLQGAKVARTDLSVRFGSDDSGIPTPYRYSGVPCGPGASRKATTLQPHMGKAAGPF